MESAGIRLLSRALVKTSPVYCLGLPRQRLAETDRHLGVVQETLKANNKFGI